MMTTKKNKKIDENERHHILKEIFKLFESRPEPPNYA